MVKPHLQHLTSAKDLQTTYEAVRAGFVALALEKNRRATPYVAEARALKVAASRASDPAGLLDIQAIQTALLAAAGVSDKAAGHLTESDKLEAKQGLIGKFLEPAGKEFVEELVFRFLLNRGDTLGGAMRNIGGFLAQRKLSRAVMASLRLAGMQHHWFHKATGKWSEMPEDDADIELQLSGLAWQTPKGPRTFVYNRTIRFLKNNVDLLLFDCEPSQLSLKVITNPASYLAVGELKGGIDPAGADEHWKTAISALDRIHKAFKKRKARPSMFFIGAAIESKMAREIWAMLKEGVLQNAANLTDETQLASIAGWLCAL